MRTMLTAGLAGLAVSSAALAAGPDVTLRESSSVQNYGQVGGIYAYAIGSDTCNIGSSNLLWTNNGTPGLAMNAYRIYDGRLTQVGMSWVKTACCAAAGSGCGTCNGSGGSVLGAGCKDVYSASWNGGQTRLGPRSAINGFTGAFTSFSTSTSNVIQRRLQVTSDDMNTSRFTGARYVIEGVYAATDDHTAGNWANNCSYKLATINQTNFNISYTGTMNEGRPAIYAWRDHGLGTNTPDTSVNVQIVDVPGEGRFYVASKVITVRPNLEYRYEYAIFNQTSDRAGGSLSIPAPATAVITDRGFAAPLYHSGEPYSNTVWNTARNATSVDFTSPETFAQNANSNALRWGTMYNFYFKATTRPITRSATLGLFKPFTPGSVTFAVPTPAAPADFNLNGECDFFDYLDFVAAFSTNDPTSDFNGDAQIDFFDYLDFVQAFANGC